jgi:aspartate/methionine/tyrosine aminotransferase
MQLPPFRLERYFAEHEFTAPYLLCASDCESMSLAELLAFEPDAEARWRALWLGYTEASGGRELREAIAGLYTGVSPDEVLVHTGAGEAIFTFMHAALNPGDHVVVHDPGYQSLAEVARAAGAEVTPWRADPHAGWALNLDDLRSLLQPNTRLVVVNVPHNPTGFLADEAFMRGLAALAEARDFRIFSDEVYRGLEHNPADRLPAMVDLTPRATSLGVLSKTYGLAGLRIGWLASHDRALLDAASSLKDYTTICNSAPSEFLAAIALRHHDAIAERNRGLVLQNLGLLDAFFAKHRGAFTWQRPKAGPIAFPTYLGGDVTAFCQRVVERCGVLLLPGTLYGSGERAFRVGFGRANMPQALAQLDVFMQTLTELP